MKGLEFGVDKISVLIYDSQKYIHEGFYDAFAACPDIEILAKSYNFDRCLELVTRTFPDVLVFDVNAEPQSPGIVEKVKQLSPNTKLLVLSENINDVHLFRIFADGADNYCSKELSADEICKNITGVSEGTLALNPIIAQKLIRRTREVNKNQQSLLYMFNKISHLTKGELKLLRELYNGATYKEIADRKVIEVASVKKMASRLLKRMEASSIAELMETLHNLQIFEFIEKGNLLF